MNKNGNEMRKPFQDFADGFAAGARALAGAVVERDDKGDADLVAQIASLKSELSAAQSHRARNLVAQSNREGDLEGRLCSIAQYVNAWLTSKGLTKADAQNVLRIARGNAADAAENRSSLSPAEEATRRADDLAERIDRMIDVISNRTGVSPSVYRELIMILKRKDDE
jgi:hypothetical protein